MPNTVAHLGLHALFTRAIFSSADIKWIYLGAVIPDVPFVMKRTVSYLLPGVDILDVRLFAIVQASLVFSLVLAFACSRFSRRSRHVFLVLGFGVLLHLLIDACQIKWGNGPRLFAPFDWTIVDFGLFWPEQLPSHLLTSFGALYALYAFTLPIAEQARDLILPRRKDLLVCGLALGVYVFVPFVLLNSVEKSGGGDVHLIRMAERTGQTIELDRTRFRKSDTSLTVELYSGVFITLTGIEDDLPGHGKISVRGSFLANEVIQADEFHISDGRYRELASITGLTIVATYWIIVLIGLYRRK